MQQKKVSGYRPNYPKKLLKGAALTAAAMLAIGGAACEPRIEGAPPVPDDVSIDGEIPMEFPLAQVPDETPELTGEPTAEEGEEIESFTRGEVALPGKILIPEEPEQP